jgi:hypothetical protein
MDYIQPVAEALQAGDNLLEVVNQLQKDRAFDPDGELDDLVTYFLPLYRDVLERLTTDAFTDAEYVGGGAAGGPKPRAKPRAKGRAKAVPGRK